MPIFAVSILIQILLVLHIVKTGRNTTWIWIVVMLPIAGSVAYFIVEVLPELMGSRTGRSMERGIRNAVNPNRDIKAAEFDYSVADTVENTSKLANECLNKGRNQEARELFQKALRGMHQDDPYLMYGLARAEYALNNHSSAKAIMDDLIAKNPDFKNPDAHLLYARNAAALGDTELAAREYEVLDGYYPGPDASYHYAMLMKQTGDQDKAKELLDKIMHRSKTAGRHYQSMHKECLARVKRAYYG